MVKPTYEIKKPDGSIKAIALDFDGPVAPKGAAPESVDPTSIDYTAAQLKKRIGPKSYFDPKHAFAIGPEFEPLREDENLDELPKDTIHKTDSQTELKVSPFDLFLRSDEKNAGYYLPFYCADIPNHQQITFLLNLIEKAEVSVYCGSQRSIAGDSPKRCERAAYKVLLEMISSLGRNEGELGAKMLQRRDAVQLALGSTETSSKVAEIKAYLIKKIDQKIVSFIQEHHKDDDTQEHRPLTPEEFIEESRLLSEVKELSAEKSNKLEAIRTARHQSQDTSLLIAEKEAIEQELSAKEQRLNELCNIQINPEKISYQQRSSFEKLKTLKRDLLTQEDLVVIIDENKALLLAAIADTEHTTLDKILHIDDAKRYQAHTRDIGAKFFLFSDRRSFDLLTDNNELLHILLNKPSDENAGLGWPAEYVYTMSETSASPTDIKRQFLFHPLLLNKLYQETYVGHLENGAKFDENFASIKEQSPALAATLCLMHGIKLREAHRYEKAQEYFAQFKQWATTQCMPEDIQDQLIRDLKSPFNEMTSAKYTKLCEAKIESLGSEQVLKIWYALEDQFSDPALRQEKLLQALQQFPVAQQKAFYDAVNKIRAEIVDANDTAQLFIEVADELKQKFSMPGTADAALAAEAVDASVVPDISEQVRIAVLTPHVKFNAQGKVLQELQADPIGTNAKVENFLTPDALASRIAASEVIGLTENLAFYLTNVNANSDKNNAAKTIEDLTRMLAEKVDPLQLVIDGEIFKITPLPQGVKILDSAPDTDTNTDVQTVVDTDIPSIEVISAEELEKHFSIPKTLLESTKLSETQLAELDKIFLKLDELKLSPAVSAVLKGALNQNAILYILSTFINESMPGERVSDVTLKKKLYSLQQRINITPLSNKEGAIVKIILGDGEKNVAACELRIISHGDNQAKIFLDSISCEVSANTVKAEMLEDDQVMNLCRIGTNSSSKALSTEEAQLLKQEKAEQLITNTWLELKQEAFKFTDHNSSKPMEPAHITALMLELEKRLIANGIAEDQVGSFIKPLAKKLERLLHPEKNQAELKKIIREQLEPICSSENILSAQTVIPLLRNFSLAQISQLNNYASIQNIVDPLQKFGKNSLDESLAYFDHFTYQLSHTIRPISVTPGFESNRTTALAIALRYVNEVFHNRAGSGFPNFADHELAALLQAYEEIKSLLVGYPEGEAIILGMSAFENMLGAEKVENAKHKDLDKKDQESKARFVEQFKLTAFTPRARFDQEGKIIPMMVLDPFKLKQEIEKTEREAKDHPKLDAATIISQRDRLPPDAYHLAVYDFTMPAYAEDSLKKAPELRDFSVARGSKIFLNGKEIRSQKEGDFASVSNILMQDLQEQVDNSIIEYLEAWQSAVGGGVLTSLFQNYKKEICKLPEFSKFAPGALETILLEKSLNHSQDGATIQWNFIPVSRDELIIRGISDRERVCLNLKKIHNKVEITPVNYSYELSESPLRGGERYTSTTGKEYKPEPGKPIPQNIIRAYDYWNNVWKALPKKIEGHEYGGGPEGQHDDYSYDDITALLIQLQDALVPGTYDQAFTSEDRKDIIDHWAHELYALVEPKENQVLLRRCLRALYNIITTERDPQARIKRIIGLYHKLDKEASFSDHISHIATKEEYTPSYELVRNLASAVKVADAKQAKVSPIAKENLYHALNEAKNLLVPSLKNSQEPIDLYNLLETTGVTGEVHTGLKDQPIIDLSATCLESLTQNYSSLPNSSQTELRQAFAKTGSSDSDHPVAREIANQTIMRRPDIAVNFARQQLNADETINLVKGMQSLAIPATKQSKTAAQAAAIVAKAELARSTAEQTRLFGDVIGGKVSFKAWWAGAPFNPFKKPKYTVEQLKDLILADPSSLEQVFSVKAHRELFANTSAFRELLNTWLISLDDSKTVNTIFNIISQYPDLQISPIRIRDLIVKECFQKAQESHLHDLTDFLKGYCRILNAFDNEKCYDNLVEVRNIIMSGLEDRFIAARKPGLTEVGVTGHSKDRYESRIKEFLDVQQRLAIETEDSINREAIIFGILDKLKALIDSAVQSNQSKADKKPTESALKTGLITVDGVPTAEGIANAIEIGQLCILLASNVTHQQDNADDATPKIVDTIRKWQRSKNSTFLTFDQVITSDMQNNLEQYINESEAKYWMTQVITSGLYAKDVPDSPQLSVNTKEPVTATAAAIPPTTPTVQRRLGTPQSLGYDVLDAQMSGTAASAAGVYDQHQGKRFADLLTAPHVSLDAKREGADQQAADIETQPSQQPIAPGTASLVTKFDPQMFPPRESIADEVLAGDTTRRSPSPRKGQSEEV
ncbi:MAG: hypothetical protein K0S08_361 [Gammaproteobacteria bacterium]|jgi:hypothetical protein|nr:hypothetical protein [Gammaproteobacteria bacterium]